MARLDSKSIVTISVFDRLIDNEPRISKEIALTREQSLHQLKESVRRDLEWLLNTRLVPVPTADLLREVNHSMYAYGLPDFTAYSLSNPDDRSRLVRHLHAAIKTFEPRLAKVRIVPVESSIANTRILRFRIEALLLVDPAPEHISFDTTLQLTSGEYEVVSAG
jgi:type VI secretion system protein ImpF